MIHKYDPFQEIVNYAFGTQHKSSTMAMDAYRDGDTVHIWLDVPGVAEQDLALTVEKNVLTVATTRNHKVSDDHQIYARERAQGTIERTISLGDNLDLENHQVSIYPAPHPRTFAPKR